MFRHEEKHRLKPIPDIPFDINDVETSTVTKTFELVLANTQHVRNVPGRKSDVSGAMWLADLLAHGLIRGSLVPTTPVQEMRDPTRTRKQVVREVAQHIQRIQKALEDANIKLGSVPATSSEPAGRRSWRR